VDFIISTHTIYRGLCAGVFFSSLPQHSRVLLHLVCAVLLLSCRGNSERSSLQLLLSQLGQLTGFPPLQLLFEEEQVNVDDVIQHRRGAEESAMQGACYPTAEHVLAWNRHTGAPCWMRRDSPLWIQIIVEILFSPQDLIPSAL